MFVGDTIAAISTALGQGAIAVLRVSGLEARSLVNGVISDRDLTETEPRRAYYASLTDTEGTLVDQVLVTVFAGPHSYTGEDLVEISCHGGVLVTKTIFDCLLASGCRAAEPGEFTQRAFLNGKLDLTQAEAVMDLIEAQTSLALRAANQQLRGHLGDAMGDFREDLIGIVAHIEAFIDFPEEDIDPDTGEQLRSRLRSLAERMTALLASADRGRILREGAKVVICGEPNVGKSSLLNVLLGFERAIVSDTAGTTRDTIEEVINLKGIPLRLIDTAGLHESTDQIEQKGMQRTVDALTEADVVIEVVDGHAAPGVQESLSDEAYQALWIRLLNKSDLGLHAEHSADNAIAFSCEDRSGLEKLTDTIAAALLDREQGWQTQMVAINARHQRCLVRAREACECAERGMEAGLEPEFVATDLHEALEAVGEVVGKVDVEEILGEIFGSFCIGK